MYRQVMAEPKLPAAVYRMFVKTSSLILILIPFPRQSRNDTNMHYKQPAQRNSIINIFPCPASGVWECERSGNCVSNFTLPSFGLLLRDTQLPGNKQEGIGLADPNASATAGATVTVTAGIAASNAASTSSPIIKASKHKSSDALAVGLGVGIPLGILLLACIALLFWQQRKLKEERAVAPPLGGMYERGGDDKGSFPGMVQAQELPEQRAVAELRGDKSGAHELGGHYVPGSSPPPLSLSKL